jgi:hypothetical protein
MSSKEEYSFEEIVNKVFKSVSAALANGYTVRDVIEKLIQNGFQENLAQAVVERICHSCTNCRKVLPVTGVSYKKQTGLLVVSFNQTKEATLCKSCNIKLFWECMIHCLLLGWWGIKSFFYNIAAIIGNINNYNDAKFRFGK